MRGMKLKKMKKKNNYNWKLCEGGCKKLFREDDLDLIDGKWYCSICEQKNYDDD